AVLYIDLHLIHEVTSPQAFAELESRGLSPRRPDLTKGTLDHSTPTLPADADGRLRPNARVAEDTRIGFRPWRLAAGLMLGLAIGTK
ncbi:hypothetical protein JTP77_041460, partial [Streptomyces sp. S9]|nr:hypothetical protein [Streptomyces sp. S9]